MSSKSLVAILLAILVMPLDAETVIGKSVSEAAESLGLDMMQASIITEPPAVARGLYFKESKENEIQLFIKRDQIPLTFDGGDDLEQYKTLMVIGFRRVIAGQVQCEGDVLWHFSCT